MSASDLFFSYDMDLIASPATRGEYAYVTAWLQQELLYLGLPMSEEVLVL